MANSGPISSDSDAVNLRAQTLYHGTRADLQLGDLIAPGYRSNYGKRKKATYVYLSAALDAATWGAELAAGDGPGRIYIVEAMGEIFDDPNLTDKKFPGNPTKSYRSREALKVVGEVMDRQAKKKLLWTSVSNHCLQQKNYRRGAHWRQSWRQTLPCRFRLSSEKYV